jgi:hypothetical protein
MLSTYLTSDELVRKNNIVGGDYDTIVEAVKESLRKPHNPNGWLVTPKTFGQASLQTMPMDSKRFLNGKRMSRA